MSYPDDYDARRNPQEHRLSRDQSHQVEVTHDVLDALETVKGALDKVIRKHGLNAGEVYSLFCDGFSDLEFTIRGELDIDTGPYRSERPAVREWDDAVTAHQAEKRAQMAEARKAMGHAARIAAEQRGERGR